VVIEVLVLVFGYMHWEVLGTGMVAYNVKIKDIDRTINGFLYCLQIYLCCIIVSNENDTRTLTLAVQNHCLAHFPAPAVQTFHRQPKQKSQQMSQTKVRRLHTGLSMKVGPPLG
jgi:hypothetical protein